MLNFTQYKSLNNLLVSKAYSNGISYKIVKRPRCNSRNCFTSFELTITKDNKIVSESVERTLQDAKDIANTFNNYYSN